MSEEKTKFDAKEAWNKVLSEIELTVSRANFNTWFKDTFISKFDEGAIIVGVPNTFIKEWLSKRYHAVILKFLREANEQVRSLEYIVLKNNNEKIKSVFASENKESAIDLSQKKELPLSDLYNVNKDDNLNPRYTFDNFVVGSFNELAHAASQAILRKPCAYNPLFIYGGTGRGKTHLIQAIGNHFKNADKEKSKKVFYITSEKFSMDYVNSMQQNKINSFKEKYRKYDLFIMDDIQFLTKKDKTQEELFHLFNTLYDNNKQIIFSSDKHPNNIQDIEDRLRSRFAQGMTVDIQQPDKESRMAIIKTKMEINNVIVQNEILDYMSSLDGNIREIEGMVNNMICQAQFKNAPLTLSDIKHLFKTVDKPKRNISPKDIIKAAIEYYNIEEASLYEKTRRKEVVKPRQIIMYIMREDLGISFPSIGDKLGGKDHTTVMHSYEKIKEEMKSSEALVQEINVIRSLIC